MKRTLLTLALAIVFTLSATAFAVMPTQQTTPAPAEDGVAIAALVHFAPHFVADDCPPPGDTGASC